MNAHTDAAKLFAFLAFLSLVIVTLVGLMLAHAPGGFALMMDGLGAFGLFAIGTYFEQ
jgi:hypothetical protein